MLIIGIHGPSRGGKDTICQMLVEEFPLINFERQGFADTLKISAAKSIGLEGTDKELINKMNDLKEEGQIRTPWGYVSGRQFLQNYGTEAHRDLFGNDFWLDQVIPDIMNPKVLNNGRVRNCDVLLIPDVRYQNEAGRIIDAGGILWKISRKVKGHNTGHISENEVVAQWDAIIKNNGTKQDLRHTVKKAFIPVANRAMNNRIEKAIAA